MCDRFAAISEVDVLSWLSEHTRAPNTVEAYGLGRLVRDRGFTQALDLLMRLVRFGHNELAVAASECANLLGTWDRMWLATLIFWAPAPLISKDEWWATWLDLSCTLYPLGIRENNIWTEADGDLSRVRQGSGREEWGIALEMLRRGGAGGTMTIEGLLHQMRRDFGSNAQLKLLEDIYLKQIRYA